MALPDLTGINIENSYQRVVHTDGVNYYNGTGSLLNLGNNNIDTGSFATTGSNIFRGNQTITGSVNISGSLNTNNTLYVSASRVGIGISTPSASLQVAGDIRLASAADGANSLWLLRNSSNNWSLQSINGVGEIWRVAGNSQTFYQVGTFANGLNVTPGGNSTTYGLIVTSGSYPAATLLRVGVNSLVVTGSNVGIGTLAPSRAVEIARSGLVDGSIEGLRISTTHASSTALAAIELNHPSYGRLSRISSDVGSGGSDPSMYITHNSITAVKINSSGLVGINTLTPTARLQIKGSGATSATTAFLVQNSTPSTLFSILDNGNTGIRTLTPLATLDVSGSTRITNGLELTGSLIVTDGANVQLSTSTSTLNRLGVISVDWRNRTLNNGAESIILDWENNLIYDVASSSSIDWENRVLWDLTGGAESIDYGRRKLYNSTGGVTLDYNTGALTGTAASASFVNPLTQNVQITGSLLVKDILQLAVRTTTPTPVEGMIIASGSAGASKVYYYNGTTWNALF